MSRGSKFLFGVCAVYGPLLVVMHYVTWGVGRLALGYWPRPSLDDPLGIPAVWAPYYATMGLMLLLPAAVLVPLGGTFLARESGLGRRLAITAAIWGVLAVSIAILRWDPALVAVWYAD